MQKGRSIIQAFAESFTFNLSKLSKKTNFFFWDTQMF